MTKETSRSYALYRYVLAHTVCTRGFHESLIVQLVSLGKHGFCGKTTVPSATSVIIQTEATIRVGAKFVCLLVAFFPIVVITVQYLIIPRLLTFCMHDVVLAIFNHAPQMFSLGIWSQWCTASGRGHRYFLANSFLMRLVEIILWGTLGSSPAGLQQAQCGLDLQMYNKQRHGTTPWVQRRLFRAGGVTPGWKSSYSISIGP